MKMEANRTAMVVLASVGGAAMVVGTVCAVRSSRQYKAMRAVRRTNMVLRRVGRVLTAVADATEHGMEG